MRYILTYADGNETRVKTATGTWSVTYNGENRPIMWIRLESNNQTIANQTIVSMTYDRMGRRVTKGDQRFVYDGYLQIESFHSSTSTSPFNSSYEYAPFGALTAQRGASAAANPWRFSSEYAEDETGTVYYNYRHYEPGVGRWMQRDPGEEIMSRGLFFFSGNEPIYGIDYLGMECVTEVNATLSFNFSVNVGLGEISGSYVGSRSSQRCSKKCSACKKGYTVETTVSWGGSIGGSWTFVTPIGIPIDVGYSMELDKSAWSFYDSCTGKEQSGGCGTLSVSISAGKCFKIGPWIKHCFYIDGTYVYSDCGSGQNNFSVGITWQQCYGFDHAGSCISTRWSPWKIGR